jgi:proline dehydrogenase
MSDELTERVANAFATDGTPMVLKYLPYGQLSDECPLIPVGSVERRIDLHVFPPTQVLPYLGRRAIENKALLSGDSGTTAERRRVVTELKRRIGWSSQHKQM